MSHLKNLASLGQAINNAEPPASLVASLGPEAGGALDDLLTLKNGFYAFENALHVLPAQTDVKTHGLLEWNDPKLWREAYSGMADSLVFFAEDIFGNAFCLQGRRVLAFDAETGETQELATDLDDWARIVLADYNLYTGFSLAHAWQVQHAALAPGTRLLPKKPFVLGGEYQTGNLYPLDSVKGMRLRGSLATQIRDLPDGSSIRWSLVD